MNETQKREVVATLLKAGRRDLAEQFVGGVTMPTGQLKSLMQIPKIINDAARKTDAAINQLVDELQGGITPENARRINRLVRRVAVESSPLDEMYQTLQGITTQLQKMAK